MPIIAENQLKDLIEHPTQHRASGVVVALQSGKRLPQNSQVGPTCGIYSLDGALRLRGGWYAPPARNLGTRDKMTRLVNPSAIRIAKQSDLSQVGEIGSCEAIQSLAATMGYASTEIKRFDSPNALWAVITDSAKARKGIVMPYVCLDGGEAASDGNAGFAHWCLVFGRYERSAPLPDRRVLAVTYGKYFHWGVGLLQRSNAAIRDWESQIWVRYPMWWSDPNAPDEARSWVRSSLARNNEWMKETEAGPNLDMVAGMLADAGWGFGLGFADSQRNAPGWICLRATRWAPPGGAYMKPSLNLARVNQLPGVKRETLRAAAYSQTMANRCIVV
jgi:hypothetical protein